MANFNKAGSAKAFGEVKKVEQEKANVIALQNIRNSNLVDNPNNGEDISRTEDLEKSMRENGFTDPMEVTDFGMESGKYMILSGHRRRAAGVKVFGEDFAFPCVVRNFSNENEIQNYTLMANAQRDSAKDPLLFSVRYKMHEDYLKRVGFKGSFREEIAERLGISVQQADRYNAMNKIILPVWDMVRAEIVGMSSVQPMAKHSEEEQGVIYNIMQEAMSKDVTLSRDTVKMIIDGFRNGKTTWAEIADIPRDSGLPLNGFMNTDPTESREPSENGNRNDEVRHDADPIAAEYDAMDADREAWEREQEEADGKDKEENGEENEKPELSPLEKQIKAGKDISKLTKNLDTKLQDIWKCEDDEAARDTIINFGSLIRVLIDESYRLSDEHDLSEEFTKILADVKHEIEQY